MSFGTKLRNFIYDSAGWGIGAITGYNPRESYVNMKMQREALESQQRAYAEQSNEIARQKKIQQDQQRRENEQLMNAVSGLTNTSYSGVSSPTLDYDKYGDLG